MTSWEQKLKLTGFQGPVIINERDIADRALARRFFRIEEHPGPRA